MEIRDIRMRNFQSANHYLVLMTRVGVTVKHCFQEAAEIAYNYKVNVAFVFNDHFLTIEHEKADQWREKIREYSKTINYTMIQA